MSQTEKPSETDLLRQLNSLGDSVNLVMSIMAKDDRSQEAMERMYRNYLHILDVCKNPWYSSFNMEWYYTVGKAAELWYNKEV